MMNPGSVSLENLSAKLSKMYQERAEVPEYIVRTVIVITFIAVWITTFLMQGDDNWKVMLMGLIPIFLTFNSRKRSTIIMVGLVSIAVTILNIWIVNPKSYTNSESRQFAIKFFVTLSISISYFANRQRNMLHDEQRKRARRDLELRELERAYSALKRSQHALRRIASMLAENAPVAIAQLTPELIYTMVNPIYLKLIRTQTGDTNLELNGKSINEYRALADQPADWEKTLQQIKEGSPVKLNSQSNTSQADGTVTYYDWTIWPVKDDSGLIESVLVLGADVTERIRAEIKLETALSELEKSNQAKDTFLATLSHELRTPLTPILGWAQIIQDYPANTSVAHRGLRAIERNARLQTQLVDDLLDLSRITMGKIELARGPINFNEIVRRALETVHYRWDSESPHLTINLSPEVLLVNGDATRLEQIVWNVLSNAIKFTPQDSTITISSRKVENECLVEIRDEGIGIDPEMLPLLFEPFKQADSSLTRRHGGLGIGLAIVKSLVEMHGGTIKASSEGLGKGSIFTMRLPLFAPFSDQSLQPPASPSPKWLKGVKILILEDSFDTRELLGTVLRAKGGEVILTETVHEALQNVGVFKPDVIISDIGLPEEDGYEFVRQLFEVPEYRKIPVIALTGFAMESDKEKVLASGFKSHISKPVDPSILVDQIHALITSAIS